MSWYNDLDTLLQDKYREDYISLTCEVDCMYLVIKGVIKDTYFAFKINRDQKLDVNLTFDRIIKSVRQFQELKEKQNKESISNIL